jgi:hypothetical protein
MADITDPKATNVTEEDEQKQPELSTEQQEQEEEKLQQEGKQQEESEEQSDDEPEERPASRREKLRIQQLLAKLKDERVEDEPPAQSSRRTPPEDDPTEQPDKRRNNWDEFGQRMYNEGLQRAQAIQFHTRLEIDAPRIEGRYPQLDKNSEEFNPVLADALNKGYLTMVGYNPKTDTVKNSDIRYADYIEAQFELASEIASTRVAEETKSVRRQAAQTGLRPDGSEPAKRLNLNKPASQMTDEELKAKIRQLNPNAQFERPSRI